MKIISNATCTEVAQSPLTILEDMQCAWQGKDGTSTTCTGDDGSPLMVDVDEDSKFERLVLAGIYSFGTEKCPVTHPSVYTRVAFYTEWLHAAMSLGL